MSTDDDRPPPVPPDAGPAAAGLDLRERDVRQRDLVPPGRLAACHAVVIGVGAVGRQVALQLAALGVPRLTLVDDDVVGVENLAAQGYWPADLNRPKVAATAALCRSIHPAAVVTEVRHRFGRSSVGRLGLADEAPGGLVLFCCVDSIAARGVLWSAVRGHADLWVDGRMAAETLRVLASDRPGGDDRYAGTLFDPARAYAGGCAARGTIYAASIAAGLMLAQFARWLRGVRVEPDQTLNVLACELTAG